MTTEEFDEKMAAFQAANRKPRPETPTNLDPLVAGFLGRLVPRPDGLIPLGEFLALFRATLRGAKQRRHATRKAVAASLERIGVLTGLTYDKQRVVLGFSVSPPAAVTLNEQGRIVRAT